MFLKFIHKVRAVGRHENKRAIMECRRLYSYNYTAHDKCPRCYLLLRCREPLHSLCFNLFTMYVRLYNVADIYQKFLGPLCLLTYL